VSERAVLAQGDKVIMCVKTDDFSLHQMSGCARLQLTQQTSVTVGTVPEC